MAYLTQEYYTGTFGGTLLPTDETEFAQLARLASDVIDAVVRIPIDPERVDMDEIAKACAYEAEYLYSDGGIDAVMGKAKSLMAVSEHLDDYQITEQQTDSAKAKSLSVNGIPFSALALAILRRQGLTCRWFYSGRARYGN